MKVLDSCTIIHSDKDYTMGGYVTTSSVLSEIISDTVRLVVEQGLREEFIKVRDPKTVFVEKAGKAAKETGDLEKLSAADLDVLALALQLNAELLSDDYAVQNVAKKIGIKYCGIIQEGIKGEVTWTKKCPACRKNYPHEKTICDVCGTTLRRKMHPKVHQKKQ